MVKEYFPMPWDDPGYQEEMQKQIILEGLKNRLFGFIFDRPMSQAAYIMPTLDGESNSIAALMVPEKENREFANDVYLAMDWPTFPSIK